MTKGHNSPQNYDKDRQWQATSIHEQMKEKDVYDHRAQQDKRQRHVSVYKQKRAARDLKRTYNEHVM